jgi:hypothetical protein
MNERQQACLRDERLKQSDMNHLLQHISWTTYLTGKILLPAIYYLFIVTRFYAADMRSLFDRLPEKQTTGNELPVALQYQESAHEAKTPVVVPEGTYSPYQRILNDTDHLAGRLKARIGVASKKAFAPAVLIS